MLLISPISWSHHWVWLALIIPVFAWRWLTIYKQQRALITVIGVWAALILTNPPKWWFGDDIDTNTLAI